MASTPVLSRQYGAASADVNRRRRLVQKVVAATMMLVGLGFVVLTLVANLLTVGPAFERLTDGFRPAMTPQATAVARQDLDMLAAADQEFSTKVLPALAGQLNLSPAQMNSALKTTYPDVAAGVEALPTIVSQFNGLVDTLEAQQPLFTSADAIPTKNLPANTVPWALLGAGLILIGMGAYMWFQRSGGPMTALVTGIVVVAVPLLLSMPQKAADADQMNANLKPVYTQQLITDANAALSTLSVMGSQMRTEMLPALASQLKMTTAEFNAYFEKEFPASAKALNEMPAAAGRFGRLVNMFKDELGDYNTLKPVSFVPIVWTMIIGGAVLVLVGLVGVVLQRSRFAH